MAKITTELIKKLREITQVGMMNCKKALIESEGDIEKAIELLRKKGATIAQKRAENEINNGYIESCISKDLKTGVLIKIGCETDFAANTQAMKDFAKDLCSHILNSKTTNEMSILEDKFYQNENITIQDKLNELISKISEHIKLTEFVKFHIQNDGIISNYIHPGANLGVMIELDTDKEIDQNNLETLKKLGKDICMQIAVTNPLSIRPEELDQNILEKEQEIIKEQLIKQGKPENMIEKIMQGKLQKFYEEVCLLNQKFIKNDKITIKQHIENISQKTGFKININCFSRLNIGK